MTSLATRKTIILLLLSCCCFWKGYPQVSAIDSIVSGEMRGQHIPGLSLAIVKNGRVIVSRGYGYANVNLQIPATEHTVYKIGSLSKQIIAARVMWLKEQGKLSLEDHVTKYYPDAPAAWKDITIRNLLNHTSGIERESPTFSWMKRQPDEVVIRGAYRDKLLFAPGTGWAYSNVGYFILADIIRQVTGQSFEDHMNTFFAASGMAHTITTTKSAGPEKATGYNYHEETGAITEAKDFAALRPSGAFSSSIADMLKWDSIVSAGTLLTKEDRARMWEDTVRTGTHMAGHTVYYGYGWETVRYKDHRLVNHNGATRGFKTEYWNFIDDRTSIIILTNNEDCSPGKITKLLYDALN